MLAIPEIVCRPSPAVSTLPVVSLTGVPSGTSSADTQDIVSPVSTNAVASRSPILTTKEDYFYFECVVINTSSVNEYTPASKKFTNPCKSLLLRPANTSRNVDEGSNLRIFE